MRNARITILVMVVILVVSGQAMALTQYNDGGTYNITTTINDDVWVDWATSAGTTVNIQEGGTIPSPYRIVTWSHSNINLNYPNLRILPGPPNPQSKPSVQTQLSLTEPPHRIVAALVPLQP